MAYNDNMHKSHEQLHNELAKAAKQITVGANYAHYKNPDNLYEVLHIAVTENDDELCVIYRAAHDPELVFVRPISSWLAKIDVDGKPISRFAKVD